MATQTTQGATEPNSSHKLPAERELIIDVHRDDCVLYRGTAAQLIAEGVIPEGLEWPRASTNKTWQANGFDYWLFRVRPEGHKGPMRSWLELDNWSIRVKVTGRDWRWHQQEQIKKKAKALADEIYGLSPAGRSEWFIHCDRLWAARKDAAYQAFKAKFIPERKKPGRKPKATVAPTPQGASNA